MIFAISLKNSNTDPCYLPSHIPNYSPGCGRGGYERDACGGGPAALPTQVFEQVPVEVQKAIE